MIDVEKRNRLISYLKGLESSGAEEILLTPENYFNGYEDDQCIICANQKDVSTSAFRARLAEIAARPEVRGVFVHFDEYDDALEDPNCWVGSDSVYVVTSAEVDTVRQWFEDFDPTDVWEEPDPSGFANLPKMPSNSQLVAVWWD